MKNIQVIDGADNCTYSIYAATEEEFKIIFPADGQDIEFIEDALKRNSKDVNNALEKVWNRYIEKKDIQGIHGTLFYELENKKQYYPTKKDAEMVTGFEI
jgi:hypothetical protein